MKQARISGLLGLLACLSLIVAACDTGGQATAVPPTAVPPTAMPATAMPATAMPATAAPATAAPTTAPTSSVFSWRAYAEPGTMDPALIQENLSVDLSQNLYDALVQFNPETQKIEPALAESLPEVNADASVYTFHLRKDAKFSNGDPVTSADVKYSYNRVANTPDAPYTFVMDDIKGFGEVRASVTSTDTTKPKVTEVSGIETPDDYTVKITLKNSSAYFLSEATLWTYYVVNKKMADKGGADWMIGTGAGTGAYTLTEWKHNESMAMKPNPNYWGPKATVDAQILILPDTATAQAEFEKGTLSALDGPDPNDLARIKADAKLGKLLHSVGQARSVWIGLNVQKPPFGPQNDPKALALRQALSMAINRQELVDVALSGAAQPLTNLMPEGEPGYKKVDAYPFDPAAAKAKMAEAGYPNGQGLDLTYTYRQRDAEKRVAEQIQAQMKENLGIDIKIEGIEWGTMLPERQAHKYTMFYGSWGHDYPDPQNWLYALFHSSQIQGVGPGTGNDPGWSNPEFDKLVEQGNVLADPAKVNDRMALYQQAEEILLKDAPLVPLYQATRYWEVSDKWTGYNTNNSSIFPFRYIKPAQ